MKNYLIPCVAVALLVGFGSLASAGEPSKVADSTLSNMGLGSMQTLSDADGQSIRGKGTFANVWGGSTVNFHGQTANNNYEAGASWIHKSSLAKGSSLSYAGKFEASFAMDPTGSALSASAIGGFAGGKAAAFAH